MEMASCFLCGSAIRDITPTVENGVLPMPVGFSASNRPLTCVHDPLNLRVIALGDAHRRLLLVSMDVVNLDASYYGPVLSAHTGLPENAIFFIETTAHSTIRAGAEARNGTDPEGLAKHARYTLLVKEQMLAAADEALHSMKAAKVGIGRAESYVNVNRYADFTVRDETGAHSYCNVGFHPPGTSDHTAAVLRFEDRDGVPIAFLINYAVFNVVMADNIGSADGGGAISADLAGYVSTQMERRYAGAVSMWCGGAGCDQNPIMAAKMGYPDPDGGKRYIEFGPEACDAILTYLGQIHYTDILRAAERIEKVMVPEFVKYHYDTIEIPARRQLVDPVEENRFVKIRYQENGVRNLHLAMIRLGEIAIVLHSGGIFSEIGMEMKQKSLLKDTLIVTGFVNSVTPFDGVICDDDTLRRGGHDAGKAKHQPGFAASALVLLENKMIRATDSAPYYAETLAWSGDMD